MTTFPIVNINGDSVETLISQQWAVLKAAQELRNKLSQAAPHGRNFQTQPIGATTAAREEWLATMVAAKAIEDQASATVNDLMRQAHQRMSSQQVGEMTMRVMR